MAETNSLRVRLVTPDRILVDQTADAVEVPSASGYFEALYGAAPLLAALGAGEVRLHGGEAGDQRFNVARGFVEVLPERVTILAESAMRPEEIDAARAQKELDEGNQAWSEAGEDEAKYARANEILREAQSKLDSAQGHA